MNPRFSIVIPARDEEHYLPRCLDAIERAAAPYREQVEVIVVINRCTDATEEIARARGARVVHDDSKCLSSIRNAGAREAAGEILLTIDADSVMSEGLLSEVEQLLSSGRYIGGGTRFSFDRPSVLLGLLTWMITALLLVTRIAGACFWCLRRDFWAVNGFDEGLTSFEDVDFARRLKRHGKQQGKRFKVLVRSHIITAERKFSLLWRHPLALPKLLLGRNEQIADLMWYETPRHEKPDPTAIDHEGER